MIDVAIYQTTIADFPNKQILEIAKSIIENKVLEIDKVLKNPTKYDKGPFDSLTGEDLVL